MMFKSLRLQNFKAFEDFTVTLNQTNILVGVNNAGKSTVLDAFRALSGGLRLAARQRATLLQGSAIGYQVSISLLPITTKNLHTDYRDSEAQLTFTLSNKRQIKLTFPATGGCQMTLDASLLEVSTLRKFHSLYPVSVDVVPTLGPLEEEEDSLTDEYFNQVCQSRRSHRHFRNIWIRQSEEKFAALNDALALTWPSMRLHYPEREGYAPVRLVMFCEETTSAGRRLRELYWAGFGFQIWIQFLTHLLLVRESSLMVVDEPDIYLHPELQRRLYNLLLGTGKQFILATHSSEVINEADPDDILVVDREKRFAKRIRDVEGLQSVLDRIGSRQNIYLTKLSMARKILFVEGHDFGLIRRFARRIGLKHVAEGEHLTAVALEGFSNSRRVEDVAWAFERVLKANIRLAVLLDRDYRCSDEVIRRIDEMSNSASHVFFLNKKEIENYLLCPGAIAAAASERVAARVGAEAAYAISLDEIVDQLDVIGNGLKLNVRSNIDAFRLIYFEKSGLSRSTILREGAELFEEKWRTLEGRIELMPGKEVLARLNEWLQYQHGVSVTPAGIVAKMKREDIPGDLFDILQELENFAAA